MAVFDVFGPRYRLTNFQTLQGGSTMTGHSDADLVCGLLLPGL